MAEVRVSESELERAYCGECGEQGHRAFCTVLFAQLLGGGSDVGWRGRMQLSDQADNEK